MMLTLRLQRGMGRGAGDVQMLCACDPAQGKLKRSCTRFYFVFPAGEQQWRSLKEEPSLLLCDQRMLWVIFPRVVSHPCSSVAATRSVLVLWEQRKRE